MTRSLIALACLLTFAKSASADGAWVLWEASRTNKAPSADAWAVKNAHETRAACESALIKEVAFSVETWRDMGARFLKPGEVAETGLVVRAGTRMVSAGNLDDKWFVMLRYDCLPATVDPRGPKER